MTNFSAYEEEKEVLIAPGTIFKILYKENIDNIFVIDLEMIDSDQFYKH